MLGVSKVTKVLLGVFVGQGLAAADPELIQESSITEMDSGLFERSIEGNSFKCTDELACSGKTYCLQLYYYIVHIIITGGGGEAGFNKNDIIPNNCFILEVTLRCSQKATLFIQWIPEKLTQVCIIPFFLVTRFLQRFG